MRFTFDARANSKEHAKDPKARSLSLARRLFPNVKMEAKADSGKAEALLMAMYAANVPD